MNVNYSNNANSSNKTKKYLRLIVVKIIKRHRILMLFLFFL